MMVTMRMTEEEKQLAEAYAKLQGLSLSEAIKKVFFEHIEDEYDAAMAEIAFENFKKDPVTYTFEEVAKELHLDV